MIPKIIHYCWFGGNPLPKVAQDCIKTWKKFMPDYEIKLWDESNFDVNSIPYTAEAYQKKKYAFVSDYARFAILYKEGGIYLDTDVELIKPLDDIVEKGCYMGCESDYEAGNNPLDLNVNPGLGMAAFAGEPFLKKILENYKTLHFINPDGTNNYKTVVLYTTELLCEEGLKNLPDIQKVGNYYIYPSDYFCPISTKDGKLRITKHTYSIHLYAQSWQSPFRKYGRKFILLLGGENLKKFIKKLIFIK